MSEREIITKELMEKVPLVADRAKYLGPTYTHFYKKPLHLVKGQGIWVWDNEGARLLDFYNNVPHVGHCHPHVLHALTAQAATLNTHTRYLHENIVNLAKKLTTGLPGALADGVCIFTCTGSEANDLAVRMAKTVSGNEGLLCSTNAYHGGTCVTFELSPERVKVDGQLNPLPKLAHNVATFEAPNSYRRKIKESLDKMNCACSQSPNASTACRCCGNRPSDLDYFLSCFDDSLNSLAAKGLRPAAVIVDPIFSSNGLLDPPKGYLQEVCRRTRKRGGLYIADEVQAGLGRTGTALWGFQNHGLEPDIITLGKPLGNGHPVAALITTRKIAESFASQTDYFNTFGGNPVSCAVGLAVLEVIENERLTENARVVGAYLKKKLQELQPLYSSIGDVRGVGLSLGVEMVRENERPNPLLAELVINGLRNSGVMIARTGEFNHVLKIRPPLVASVENCDLFLGLFEKILRANQGKTMTLSKL